jgi:hypothetical protein
MDKKDPVFIMNASQDDYKRDFVVLANGANGSWAAEDREIRPVHARHEIKRDKISIF